MKELTTTCLSVETILHKTNTLSSIAPTCSTISLGWIRPGYQFNDITLLFFSSSQLWIWACIYRAQWIGIVERIMGEVAIRSYQEGSRLQLIQIDRDKGGHEAQVLEASRILSFSIFTKGITFVPLWQSCLTENCCKRKAHAWWHHFSITGHRRCWTRYRSSAKGKARC